MHSAVNQMHAAGCHHERSLDILPATSMEYMTLRNVGMTLSYQLRQAGSSRGKNMD